MTECSSGENLNGIFNNQVCAGCVEPLSPQKTSFNLNDSMYA